MKILMSAYNCSPYRGSESTVGWNSALTAAKSGREVTVITNFIYRDEIERYLKENSNDTANMHFIYIQIPSVLMNIKGYVGELIQYRYFQKNVVKTANNILETKSFDFIQHTSWASLIQKTMLYKLDIPVVIGPVGGGEETPSVLMSNYRFQNKLKERIRKLAILKATHSGWFKEMCSKSLVIFAATDETYNHIPEKYRHKTYVQQHIGINNVDIDNNPIVKTCEPFRVLMVGRLLYWKGFDLGIQAIKRLLDKGYNIELHIIGSGKERKRLETLASKWLHKQIFFHGSVNYEELKDVYMKSNILVNTSLHDSGCLVVLEAMAKGLPVVCIDTGGPKVLTTDDCAIKIVPQDSNKTIENIKQAIEKLIENPQLCEKLGEKAKSRALDQFEYSNKYKAMEEIIVRHLDISSTF